MKAIMYHYVRPDYPDYPYFSHLHIDNFVKQIEYFGNKYGFVSLEKFQQSLRCKTPNKGVILTFDDGFSDHYKYVFPELKKRNLWGIFYVPTSPYLTGNLIDVHRIHLLVGKYGGESILSYVKNIINEDMLSHKHIKEFHMQTYTRQNNSTYTNQTKRLLNYFIDYKHRSSIINQLMEKFFPDEKDISSNFYISKSELKEMFDSDMVIGSHTVNHMVMSKLSLADQELEITRSFDLLDCIVGRSSIKTFCYPYGGFHTFTTETEKLLEENNCDFSFNVESRDIDRSDLNSRIQALPRYDCNQFPYGSLQKKE